MPPVDIPSDATQQKVLRAFRKLGFEILAPGYGKGSHRLVRDSKSGSVITVQYHIRKDVLRSFCRIIRELGYSVEEFIDYL